MCIQCGCGSKSYGKQNLYLENFLPNRDRSGTSLIPVLSRKIPLTYPREIVTRDRRHASKIAVRYSLSVARKSKLVRVTMSVTMSYKLETLKGQMRCNNASILPFFTFA